MRREKIMTDNRPELLIFDQNHYEATGVYTLVSSDYKTFYSFRIALKAKAFVDDYYTNKFAAIRAYQISLEGKNHEIH